MPSENFKIENYVLLRKDRCGRGGGVGLYVLEKLKPHIVEVIDFNNGIDQLWVKFKCKKLTIVVGVVYRPPNVSCNELSCLYEVLPEIVQSSDVCICTGDFNIDCLCQSSVEYKNLNTLLSSFNLTQLIKVPTRITSDTETIIDLIIVNRTDLVLKSGVVDCTPIATDHEAVYCSINCSQPKKNHAYREFRNFSAVDLNEFEKDLQSVSWHALYTNNNIDTKVSIFNNILINVFDKHCPSQKAKIGKPKPPWLTYNL